MRNYDPKNYVRMFAGEAFSFLYADIFLEYYSQLGVVVAHKEDGWITFLPKGVEQQTVKEGKELYTDIEAFQLYRTEFQKYITDSKNYFQKVLNLPTISPEVIEEFFKQASRHFSYYSKTEFFYTNGVKPEDMVISVAKFDELKLTGRSYLNQILFEEQGFVKNFLKKLSQQIRVDVDELLDYTIHELKILLSTGQKIDSTVLKQRVVFFAADDLRLFGDEAKSLVDEFILPYSTASDTIKGTTANKGKAKGKARVLVVNFKDFSSVAYAVNEMQQGEILVAETTAPEIIAACKKAAAIVTNQGGMLSHAAIVSRELGVPCIVGTDKDVIKNIATGDLLDIDADNGILKIIK